VRDKDVERQDVKKQTVEVKRRALELGFSAVGVATLEPTAHGDFIDRWLAAGYGGTMTYLNRQAAKRKDPRAILPNARCAVVTLTNYYHGPAPTTAPRVAQYAWSTDYHVVLGERLERLASEIAQVVPGSRSRAYVDAGPVPERELAQRAGLGWIGKNAMLIRPTLGSFTFIGVVLTDAPLEPDLSYEMDRCGTCTRCLDACPTDAFVAPRTLDARRCISYLTIERRGEFSAAEAALTGDWLFGCDVCQDVCPWNERFAPVTGDPAFTVRAELVSPGPGTFAALDQEEFDRRFKDTPFSRPGLSGLQRNAAVLA
jgi:epoxyqueuosine reductase